jgi:hypothetical protein
MCYAGSAFHQRQAQRQPVCCCIAVAAGPRRVGGSQIARANYRSAPAGSASARCLWSYVGCVVPRRPRPGEGRSQVGRHALDQVAVGTCCPASSSRRRRSTAPRWCTAGSLQEVLVRPPQQLGLVRLKPDLVVDGGVALSRPPLLRHRVTVGVKPERKIIAQVATATE